MPRVLPDGKRAGPVPPVKCPCGQNVEHSAVRSGDAFDFCHCGRCVWFVGGFVWRDPMSGEERQARIEYETSPEELAWMERHRFTLEQVLEHFTNHPVTRPSRAA